MLWQLMKKGVKYSFCWPNQTLDIEKVKKIQIKYCTLNKNIYLDFHIN